MTPNGSGPFSRRAKARRNFLRHSWAARVPADCDPRKGPVTLLTLQQEQGHLGRNWDVEEGGYQTLPTAPFTSFTEEKTVASWLINSAYATDWQQFQRDGHLGNREEAGNK